MEKTESVHAKVALRGNARCWARLAGLTCQEGIGNSLLCRASRFVKQYRRPRSRCFTQYLSSATGNVSSTRTGCKVVILRSPNRICISKNSSTRIKSGMNPHRSSIHSTNQNLLPHVPLNSMSQDPVRT